MDQQKFMNYYVDNLINALHDQIKKNIIFQTQQKISGEEIEGLRKELDQIKNSTNDEKDNIILNLKAENSRLQVEATALKSSSSNAETFRKALKESNEKLESVTEELEKLKNSKK